MTEDEKRLAVGKIHERARYMRGRFLNHVAVIERDIALILTDYFCTSCASKRQIFFDNIVTKGFFGLRSKRDVLYRILKQHYPRYWEDNQKQLKAFDEIADFRNRLAHCVVDVSEEALSRPIEEGVAFIDRLDSDPITEDRFNSLEVMTNMLSSCLSDIRRLLPFKESPKETLRPPGSFPLEP